MARFTLRIYSGAKLIEGFEHRSAGSLREILNHPRNHRAGQTGPFGEPVRHPDRFEVYDAMKEKLFVGNIEEAELFAKKLK